MEVLDRHKDAFQRALARCIATVSRFGATRLLQRPLIKHMRERVNCGLQPFTLRNKRACDLNR